MIDEKFFNFIREEVVKPIGVLQLDIESIKDFIRTHWGYDLPKRGSTAQSPRTLNELGRVIEKELNEEVENFTIFLEGETLSLYEILKANKIESTPYNVQIQAFKKACGATYEDTPEIKKSLEHIAYNHGNDLKLIEEVLGIVIRDNFFEKYKTD